MNTFSLFFLFFQTSGLQNRLSFPEVPSSPATLSDAVVIMEDIVMKSGKTMYVIYGTAETWGFDGKTQGELDSKSTKRTLK